MVPGPASHDLTRDAAADPGPVGVVGCGLMGSGIVEAAALAGLEVTVLEVDAEALDRGRERVRASLDRGVERERLTASLRDQAHGRIAWATRAEALAPAKLVVEAVVESMETKVALFRRLDEVVEAGTVLATNTSSLSVTELAAATAHPGRVVGIHFFNPVPIMRLAEVVSTVVTTPASRERAMAFVRALGKEALPAPDRCGFLVNRLLVPYLLDAIREVERGLADVETLDRAMVLGCGHPMGPLTLADFVGNDTLLRIAEVMFDEFREPRFAPPPLLRRLVALGRYGRKSGTGFLDWTENPPRPLPLAP